METVASIDQLSECLRNVSPGALVALEGFCSSGKTPLANQLGECMPMAVFHTDDFASKFDTPPPYPECLNIGRMRAALESRDHSRPSIVEGICLRDVLALMGRSPTLYVYVKRIGRNGLWYDQMYLEDFEGRKALSDDIPEPHLSDLTYHSRSRPHERADLIYERVADE